jgi:hypothetical protein
VTQKLKFQVKHPRFAVPGGPDTVEVLVDGDGAEVATAEDLIEIVREACVRACREAVRRELVSPGSSARGTRTQALVDELAGQCSIVGASLEGDVDRYAVLGRHGDGSDYVGRFSCVTQAEAEFQARWALAAAEASAPCFDDFLDAMGAVEIIRSHPGPISAAELRAALEELLQEVQEAGHSGPAFVAGVALLRTDGFEPSSTQSPRP